MKNTFYITTPIYYPNAKPHIGSVYSTVLADIIARYQKLMGKDVFFLTGLDEHGQKVYEAAQKVSKDTKQFVDELAVVYQRVFDAWGICYDIFMRTTSSFHKETVSQWIVDLQKKGFIYKATYSGWYSTSSEAFLTEKDIECKDEKGTPLCPITQKPAQWISQEAYFFKLSFFQDKLMTFLEENPGFIIPKERTEEITSFIKGGLRDLCVSRLKKDLEWGIPFPGDNDHVIYVWADALNNYITSIGYKTNQENFNNWWPASVHVMAKDIIRFHAVYWLAFLMASDLPLPKNELVHGWLLIDNQKMSKSLGNIVDPDVLLEKYEADSVRYYFSTLSIKEDSNFTIEDLEKKHNSDLCDNLSNLLQRMVVLCHKKGVVSLFLPEKIIHSDDLFILEEGKKLITQVIFDLEQYQILKITNSIMAYVKSLNAYFHQQVPWKENDIERFKVVMSVIGMGLYYSGVLLSPIMPTKMKELLDALSINLKDCSFSNLTTFFPCMKLKENQKYLFTKIVFSVEQKKLKLEDTASQELAAVLPKNISFPLISFDEFLKAVILVGQIKEINEIPKSDKLYYLTVDFGLEYGTRKIASGIKQYYKKEQLQDIKTIFSFNLAPRALCGVVSEGMILMTKNTAGVPQLICIDENVAAGNRVG